MFLHTKLENRKDPIKICFIGCGKFVSMFLAQYNHLEKIQIDTIVDVNLDQAKKNCLKSGLNEQIVKGINFSNSLTKVQNDNQDVEIGSYPFFHAGKLGVSIVIRSEDQSKIDLCNSQILKFVSAKKIEVVER